MAQHASADRIAMNPAMLCVIVAHNEAANLPLVISGVRSHHQDLDILVVDDGSTDATPGVLQQLDIRWLRLPERMGIGSAMRAGLRYALRRGYDYVLRIDGDGQHDADDISVLLQAVRECRADMVVGSRYQVARPRRASLRVLRAVLSFATRRRVTDATSGFYIVGPRALRMLAEHHPTGYPEPELHLFISRNSFTVIEVGVRSRRRLHGRTSLTAGRLVAAMARVAIALAIVPWRRRVQEVASV